MNIACRAVEELVAKALIKRIGNGWADCCLAVVEKADDYLSHPHGVVCGFGENSKQATIDLLGKLGVV